MTILVRSIVGLLFAFGIAIPVAEARPVCMLVVDVASGAVLHEDGDCRTRVTPASTFKIALAAIGFDAGILESSTAPVMTIAAGEPDYGGPAWRQPVDPRAWMTHSVVWYSQRIARSLGADALGTRLVEIGYGNADVSGDPGYDNGLERAWIASSLAIAPIEQAAFARNLANRQLPLSQEAVDHTFALFEPTSVGEWTIIGKTGGAYPRNADRTFDYARGWGWFVGWARSADDHLVIVRLDQDETRHERSPGLRTRDAVLAEWPALAVELAD